MYANSDPFQKTSKIVRIEHRSKLVHFGRAGEGDAIDTSSGQKSIDAGQISTVGRTGTVRRDLINPRSGFFERAGEGIARYNRVRNQKVETAKRVAPADVVFNCSE